MINPRALLVLLPLLAGCGDVAPSAPNPPGLVIGTIDAGGTLDDVIAGPAAAAVGERVTFTVTTFGGSCVEPVGAQVFAQGIQITVIPYDRITDGVCRDILRSYPREVPIVFDRAGDAVVRVQGRSLTRSGSVTVTHTLLITAPAESSP